MKQSKVIGIILVVLNIALAVVCIILSAGQDKTKPVFDFQAAEVVYRTGMDEEKLKEGITARDNADGDITDRIVVEKIVTDPAENTAVVFFAVSDRAGNVAKCSKVFPASLEGENEELADQLTQAGYDAAFASESSLTAESTDAAADQENETDNSENAENEEQQEDAEPSESPSIAASPRPTRTPENTPKPEPEQEAVEEQKPTEAPKTNDAAPVLSLKQNSVKVAAGSTPAWVNLIGTLRDDKDSYETLFRNLKVSKYDVNKPGTYEVTVQTEDSDGNRSAAVPITIQVQ